jgi:CHASE3 domain sensor protein
MQSYLFGDKNYAKKLNERAAQINLIIAKLVDAGVNDPETIEALEMRVQELETEARKFENAFDLTRLGDMFR